MTSPSNSPRGQQSGILLRLINENRLSTTLYSLSVNSKKKSQQKRTRLATLTVVISGHQLHSDDPRVHLHVIYLILIPRRKRDRATKVK